MGQQCSCLNKDKDGFNVAFPNQINNKIATDEDQLKVDQEDEETKNSKAVNRKFSLMDDNDHSVVEKANADVDREIDETKEKAVNMQKLIKLIRMVAAWKGYITRVKFIREVKKQLEEETNDFIMTIKNNFTSTLIQIAEQKFPPFNPDGWKFNSDDNRVKKDLGRILNTKILVTKQFYYIGQVNINNECHGQGELVYKDGVKYKGNWDSNAFNSWGRYIDNQGNLHEGFFENSLLNGKGTKIFLDGSSTYIGNFKNGFKDGYGKEDCDEYNYEGTFKEDSKEGKGKLLYKKTNDLYEGEFKNNSINGYGFYVWNNKHTFTGTFLNGKMHGKGLYKWPDGGQYYGEYINNVKEGTGKFKWPNGREFEGPFKNGNPHGIGIITNGSNTQEVEFIDGKFNKEYKRKQLAETASSKATKEKEQKVKFDDASESKKKIVTP